jgi:hypothetical protein
MITEKLVIYVIMPIVCSLGVFLVSRYTGGELEVAKTWKERLKLWFSWGVAIITDLFFIYLLLIIHELYLVGK